MSILCLQNLSVFLFIFRCAVIHHRTSNNFTFKKWYIYIYVHILVSKMLLLKHPVNKKHWYVLIYEKQFHRWRKISVFIVSVMVYTCFLCPYLIKWAGLSKYQSVFLLLIFLVLKYSRDEIEIRYTTNKTCQAIKKIDYLI